MNDAPRTNGSLTRRSLIVGTAGASALGVLPFSAQADTSDLVQQVAAKARALAGTRKVTLTVLLPNGSGANVKPVVDHFQAATGIDVALIEAPVDDINTQIILDKLTENSAYDVALPATFGLPDLVAAGAIRPLTDYAAKHEPPEFRSGVLYTTGDFVDDGIYGFQTDGDAYLMFYNKAWLDDPDERARYADKHGSALEVPQTWKDLDQQLAFFHRPDAGRYGGALFRVPGYLAWEWWARFHTKGVWPFSESMTPQIASDEGIDALEDMIRASEFLAPGVGTFGLFENWERYAEGDIYCNIGWGGSQKYFNGPTSKIRNQLRFGPLPGGILDGAIHQVPYFNWGWNYVVTAATPEPELSYLLSLFASTAEMSTIAIRQQDGYFDPFRSEHYDDPKIQEIYSPEFLKIHQDSLINAIPDLYLPGQAEYFSALNEGLSKAVAREISPKSALNRIAQQWNLITLHNRRSEQKTRWKNLRLRYPLRLRSVLRDLD